MRPDARHVRQLRELAQLHGVLPSYLDVSNKRRHASPKALLGVLRALGVDLDQPADIANAIRQFHRNHWQSPLDPVCVAWNGRLAPVAARLPDAAASRPAQWRLRLEDGTVLDSGNRPFRSKPYSLHRVEGGRFIERRLSLPARLPHGYHQLELATAGGTASALIIAAPEHAWSNPRRARTWGAFAPLYALHSEGSWGVGDFRDLEQLADWTGQRGGGVISTLPLLAAFLDHPFEPSPYSPVSRLFWNELFLRPEDCPEWDACTAAKRLSDNRAFRSSLDRLRSVREVDYAPAMAAKRRALEILARSFFNNAPTRRVNGFERFLKDHPLAEDYARFRAATERRGEVWHVWPERLRDGVLKPGDFAESARRYHLYVQWQAHEQMTRLSGRAGRAGVSLYLDMPLGVNADGYDVWRFRDQFALGAAGGAPPDSVFTQGQSWGFPPLHPAAIRRHGHRYMIDFIRHPMRQAGLLRFDHVMGLRRLYWVPQGLSAKDGAYVAYPLDELCAILCLESHRHQSVIVGENLGTVPPEVNDALQRHRIREMFVVQYELQPNPRRPLRPPPKQCVASLNTHDMPPFAAMRRGLDIADRADLGLLSPSAVKRERRRCRQLHAALDAFLSSRGLLPKQRKPAEEGAVIDALLRHLASSPAETVLVNLEDLWRELLPQNVPGTSTERVNWRRKLRLSLNDIAGSDTIRALTDDLTRRRRGPRMDS